MKKILINLFAVVAVAMSLSSCGYNSMVEKQEAVTGAWAQVESQYQRRLDLIDNLVAVVKQSGKFEQDAYTSIVNARSQAGSVKVDPTKLSQEDIDRYEAAQQSANTSARAFMNVVVEAYPDLKTTEAYRDLINQLEGTENRVQVARKRYNEAVQDYNTYIRKFPNNFTAGWFDFEKKGYFKSDPEAAKAPKVKFD